MAGTINSSGGEAQTFPGTINLNNGILTGVANGTFGAFLTNPAYTTTLMANGASNLVSSANFGMSNGSTLVVNTPLATDALSVKAPLGLTSQTGKLTKSGLGTVTLSGTNTCAGTTAINGDHDNDCVDNGVEYFLGGPNGPTTGFTALPGVTNTGGVLSITWIKGGGYIGAYNTDFVVETSTTLTGPWTVEASPGNVSDSPASVTYTFPGGPADSGKRFARLKVTGP